MDAQLKILEGKLEHVQTEGQENPAGEASPVSAEDAEQVTFSVIEIGRQM